MDLEPTNNQNNGVPRRPLPPPPPIPLRPVPPPVGVPTPVETVQNMSGDGILAQAQKTPVPPGPAINVRTLQSDIASVASSGGYAPEPEKISFEDMENISTQAKPELTSPASPMALPSIESERASGGSVIGWIAVGLLAVAMGFVGYYIVYPLLFPPRVVVENIQNNNKAVPGSVPTAKKPVSEVATHRSLFSKLPAAQGTVKLKKITVGAVQSALKDAAATAASGSVKEIAMQDSNGQIRFSSLMNVLVNIPEEQLGKIAEDDFTAFVYYNEKGVWPGYVARMRSSTTALEATKTLSALENSDVKSLFLEDPGEESEFQTGPVRGAPIRYSTFTSPGASLNYGVLGNYMIVSTSFDGFKAAVQLLGL